MLTDDDYMEEVHRLLQNTLRRSTPIVVAGRGNSLRFFIDQLA